jgi:hypothetical protein
MKRSALALVLTALAGVALPVDAQEGVSADKSNGVKLVTGKTPQKAASESKAAAGGAWTPPKTKWGDPDLQGVWPGTNMVGTPLERPVALGDRATLTEDELSKKREHARKQEEIDTAPYVSKNPLISRGDDFLACDQDPERCHNGVRIGPPNYWDERGNPSTQASLIVDPPNGRIPPLTAEAQKMAASRIAARKARPCSSTAAGCHDSWEDESLWDRCISRGLVGSVVPSTYNQGNQLIQAPGYVVFRNEMIHEARVIPLGNRPHLGSSIRSWMGDSRGHWEGNTLVVETTNFRSGIPIGNTPTSEALRTIERFALTDANTLRYQLTIDDPKIWTRPWTIAFPLRRDSNYTLFEYACHEGNYYMYNALAGARADEKRQLNSRGVEAQHPDVGQK